MELVDDEDNLNSGSHLQIHLVVIETNADGDDRYNNNGFSDHEVKDYSDFDLDEVPNDIDNKDANIDENVNVYSIENPNHCKLDAKTIWNYIMPMVKDMSTIPISELIAKMQEQFQYQVSYRKA
ncbi:hypothetical protein PVK06_023771 [Gossypium arboreum]|uniref:Uncharacterized protein n=1 Tax=Gossypium arboreum TaxID=29729 RepID=A0ABR0PCB1_GOSAR|nr:hypothetical protein PVK06_023771 [Gossypium arboreum]